MDRREFLKAAGAGLASLAASPALAQAPQPQRTLRPAGAFAAGRFALDLDNVSAGWLMSAEGGSAIGEVVTERVASDMIQRKHLGAVRYEPITVEVGTGMSKAFYNWIQASLDKKYERKNGAIIAANFDYKEMSRLTFNNALITEIGLPALDAASKEAAKMTLKLAPESTRMMNSPTGGVVVGGNMGKAGQKRWLPSNFRLKMDGLDTACSRVNKIEALTIKQKVAEYRTGDARDSLKLPGAMEIPNLVIYLPESHAAEIYKWHEDFVIRGNNGEKMEKAGTLEYLTPNLQEVLFTVTFSNLGIFKVAPDKVEVGSDQIRRVKVEMYCEDIKFNVNAAAG